MDKKNHKLELIGSPNFFIDIKEYKSVFNLNNDFWNFIFDYKNVSKLINTNEINKYEREKLLFILPRLSLSFILFKKLKYKDIGVLNLYFAFNLINTFLNILNKFTGGVNLSFYDSVQLSDNIYSNIEQTIYYKFLIDNTLFDKVNSGDILEVNLRFSYQIIQIYIINYILENKYNKTVKIKILLGGLYEFEDKIVIEKILNKKISNILSINIKKSLQLGEKIIYGKNYKNYLFFNNGCNWRKCSFCNIGKNPTHILSDEGKKINRINNIISEIKKSNVDCISIFDPSIELEDLLLLSNEIIKNGINIRIHVRTKFTDELTLEVCKKLARAGVKYLGIGLESVSTRLNNLMNKYDKNYNINDFQKLVDYTDIAGINLHYYTIFGLPSEEIKEIEITRNFLLDNLKKDCFFSYTAGGFGLYRGSDIYKNNEKYGVSFEDDNLNPYILDYKESKYLENYEDINKTMDMLNKRLFINNNLDTSFNFNLFFQFLERSSIFHVQKLYFDNNLYFDFFSKSIDNNHSLFYKKNRYTQIVSRESEKSILIKNWAFGNIIYINKDLYNFLDKYNEKLSLEENILSILGEYNNYRREIGELVKGYFLI